MKYKMPLLKYTNDLVPNIDWSNTLVIACQHLLESSYLYLQKIVDNGLPANQLYVLGKSYSSCDDIIDDFKKLGVYVHPDSTSYNSHQSFDLQFRASISKFFQYIQENEDFSHYHKILIIDEGGELLSYAHQNINPVTNIVGVEQTASHLEFINPIDAKFPVVNIARSQAKLILEAPFIATALIENITSELEQAKADIKNVLVIGNSYLSQQLHEQLKFQYDSELIEVSNSLSELEVKDYINLLSNADMVIASTSDNVLSEGDYRLLKDGVILVSAGNSDSQFNAVNLRKLMQVNDNIHQTIHAKGLNGNITLLNSGFAANFDGSWQRVPLSKIQLTISLLYCAICQAHEGQMPAGVSTVDETIQEKLISEFQRMNTN